MKLIHIGYASLGPIYSYLPCVYIDKDTRRYYMGGYQPAKYYVSPERANDFLLDDRQVMQKHINTDYEEQLQTWLKGLSIVKVDFEHKLVINRQGTSYELILHDK